jgi:hypothetical protein
VAGCSGSSSSAADRALQLAVAHAQTDHTTPDVSRTRTSTVGHHSVGLTVLRNHTSKSMKRSRSGPRSFRVGGAGGVARIRSWASR